MKIYFFRIDKNRNNCQFLRMYCFEFVKTAMEINLLRCDLCTIADIVFFGTALDVGSCFVPATFPFNFGCVLDNS